MSFHSKFLTNLKNKISIHEIKDGKNILNKIIIDKENSSKTFENQQLILCNLLHAADISNPAKPNKVYTKWVDYIFNEFFAQGDLEKKENLTVSLLCDRNTTNINKAQIGFIKFVVRPTFETITILVPEVVQYLEMVNKNLVYYEKLAEEEEKVNKESKENNKESNNKSNKESSNKDSSNNVINSRKKK